MPKLSIIVPCYNSEKYLEETIKSILLQTYKDWECIFIDDHSTDKTHDILEKYINSDDKRFSLFINDKKGACAARNLGIVKSKGHYLKFLDSDDCLYDSNVLNWQIDTLENNEIDIIYGKEEYFNSSFIQNNIIKERGEIIFGQSLSSFFNNFPITSNFMVKKKGTEHFLWNEKLKSGQEFFYLFNYFINGHIFYFKDNKSIKIRVHDSSNRISNKPPNIYLNQVVDLYNEILDVIEIKKNENYEIEMLDFYKKIRAYSFVSLKNKNLSSFNRFWKLAQKTKLNYRNKFYLMYVIEVIIYRVFFNSKNYA